MHGSGRCGSRARRTRRSRPGPLPREPVRRPRAPRPRARSCTHHPTPLPQTASPSELVIAARDVCTCLWFGCGARSAAIQRNAACGARLKTWIRGASTAIVAKLALWRTCASRVARLDATMANSQPGAFSSSVARRPGSDFATEALERVLWAAGCTSPAASADAAQAAQRPPEASTSSLHCALEHRYSTMTRQRRPSRSIPGGWPLAAHGASVVEDDCARPAALELSYA